MIKNRIKMKKQIIISAMGAIFLASCADEFDHNYEVGRPDRIAEYAYLNDYQPLKEYVTNDNFKLGIGTTVSDYMNKGLVYALVNSNFTETVAGNAMKMGSIVKDNGDMDFGTVTDYVNTATDAGLSVYGHTLAWHAQQPAKWLNSLIKDRPLESDGQANRFLEYNNGEGKANSWDSQAIYALPTPMVKGKTYVVKVKVKSDEGGDLALWPIWEASPNKNQWGGSNDVQYLATYTVGTDFTEYSWEFDAAFSHDKLQFVFGKLKGKIAFDDLSIKEKGSEVEMAENGSFDGDLQGWSNNWQGPSFAIASVAPPVGVPCLTYNNGDGKDNSWDSQAVYSLPTPMKKGGKYVITITAQTENGGAVGLWPIWDASPNKNQWGGSNDVQYLEEKTVGTKFAEYVWEFNAAFDHDKLQFVFGKLKGKLYIQTISCIEVETNKELMANVDFTSGSIAGWANNWQGPSFGLETLAMSSLPLSDQEKKDTLTWAMDKWISGMMEACDGKVKAWDVVNEAISGGDTDGDGKYDLQHESDNANDFFWQNYLGDLDYVRTAVKLARKYGPEDVKLFINDYNLESDWDNNGKLKSLIQWIKDWEADGVTKIDGIGTQMHISYYLDPKTQESKQKAVENAFKLMAESGKLVRISELDMGLVDADGNDVATALVTEEQHKAMAAYYTWIIKTYLSVIPAAQQWGITQWCATDSPADSGWRANSPVGLWDKDYYRKHTYAGFADGLSGK